MNERSGEKRFGAGEAVAVCGGKEAAERAGGRIRTALERALEPPKSGPLFCVDRPGLTFLLSEEFYTLLMSVCGCRIACLLPLQEHVGPS